MGFSSGSLILVVQLPLLFTFGSWVAPHCTGSLTGMNQCVLTEVRKSERQLMSHLYRGLCSEMSPVPLVSGGEGSCVTVSDGGPFSWDTHSHRRGHMHTHTHAAWPRQHNSCSADMMVATRSHPCNPSRQRENGGHCVCVCVCVRTFLSVLMSDFNLP